MSLFLHLWIICTVIALAAAGIAFGTHTLVNQRYQDRHVEDQAATIGRLIERSMSAPPLETADEAEARSLLQQRAFDFLATGRLLSVSVLEDNLQPLVEVASPRHSENSPSRSGDHRPES